MNKTETKNSDQDPIYVPIIICITLAVIVILLLCLFFLYLKIHKRKTTIRDNTKLHNNLPIIFVGTNGLCLRKVCGEIKCIETAGPLNQPTRTFSELEYNFSVCDTAMFYPMFLKDELNMTEEDIGDKYYEDF